MAALPARILVDLVTSLASLPSWARPHIEASLLAQLPAAGAAALKASTSLQTSNGYGEAGGGGLSPSQALMLVSSVARLGGASAVLLDAFEAWLAAAVASERPCPSGSRAHFRLHHVAGALVVLASSPLSSGVAAGGGSDGDGRRRALYGDLAELASRLILQPHEAHRSLLLGQVLSAFQTAGVVDREGKVQRLIELLLNERRPSEISPLSIGHTSPPMEARLAVSA